MAGRRPGRRQAGLDLQAAAWFFENSLDAFIVTERACILRTNPAWSALTGWSAEEARGRAALEFVPDEDRPIVLNAINQLDSAGHSECEHRLRTKSGEVIWIFSRTQRVREGGALIVLKDITEERARKAESENVERSGELLRDAAGIMVWRFDPDSGVYDISANLGRPIGDAEAAALHRPEDVTAIIHRKDVRRVKEAFVRSLETGEFATVDYRHLHTDGRWARCRASWQGIRPGVSGQWRIVGVTQDITELSEARDAAVRSEEVARAAAEAKAQFLANMSHEIRTPMNGVLGVLHLLKDELLSVEGRGLLKEALACGSMLAELLNDVIDFSKIEAGRLDLAPEALRPAEALEGVASLLRPQAETRGLTITATVAPDVGWVSVDPVRLRQMLFNLIGNAVKFTLDGGVDVRMTAQGAGDARRLRVEVEDTGIGIADDVQTSLFERFHQADTSTTRRFGGSGLGLAITRRLVELMDGQIGVSSAEGHGSTFWFEIAAPAAEPADTAVDESIGGWLHGMRILVVEDNATNRLIATKLLERLGARVETAEDGAEGVAAVARSSFDLVLMDVQMPVMDGVAATQAIRKLNGPVARVPILAMSANAMAHQQQAYLECGMDGSVAKPLSPAALLAEIARVAGGQGAAAQDDKAKVA
jgi:PAS domain S-box-containing protein